jgi:hypothetical protein
MQNTSFIARCLDNRQRIQSVTIAVTPANGLCVGPATT